MTIELYVNSAERTRVDKTWYLSLVDSLEGTLRAGTSIVNPVILLELPTIQNGEGIIVESPEEEVLADAEDVEATPLDMPLVFNYAYIPDLRRYYFIRDIVAVSKSLYSVSMQCDELMSYKTEIYGLSALVTRNEYQSNPKLTDSLMPTRVDKSISVTEMARDSYVNASFNVDTSGIGNHDFIFTALAKGRFADSYEAQEIQTSVPGLPNVKGRRFTSAGGYAQSWVLTYADLSYLSDALFGDSSKESFVISCVATPFHIDTPELGKDVYSHNVIVNEDVVQGHLGNLRAPYYLYGACSQYFIVADETFDAVADYTDVLPFTDIEFYLPFYGLVSIPNEKIAGKRVIVYYTMNAYNGEGSVNIYNVTDRVTIFANSCRLGHALSFNHTNELENTNARNANTLSTLLGIVGGVISMASGNPIGVAGGALSIAKSLAGGLTTDVGLLPRATANIPSIIDGTHNPMAVQIVRTRTIPLYDGSDAESLAKYKHTFGLPYGKCERLGDLTGFTRIENVHLEDIPATTQELNNIENVLKSGVIF